MRKQQRNENKKGRVKGWLIKRGGEKEEEEEEEEVLRIKCNYICSTRELIRNNLIQNNFSNYLYYFIYLIRIFCIFFHLFFLIFFYDHYIFFLQCLLMFLYIPL